MKIYFDNQNRSNLDHLIKKNFNNKEVDWLTFNNHQLPYWQGAGFERTVSTDYNEFGIYPVSVRCNVDWWSGQAGGNAKPEKHILFEIPEKVITAAKQKKIIILIDNQTEAKDFLNYKQFDGYKLFHEAMEKLGLEYGSVVFWDGNIKFNKNYDKWLIENKEKKKIIHTYFMPVSEATLGSQPLNPAIFDAIKNEKCLDFNSLNRTPKIHRLDHLYFLISNKLISNGLVSGHYTDNLSNVKQSLTTSMIFSNIQKQYCDTLYRYCPLTIDGLWVEKNPDDIFAHVLNLKIYKSSLMSVVTESDFYGPGLFITEKTFKPIIAGHPFIIIGQQGVLEHLEELGFKTSFSGINSSYDLEENHIARFLKANIQIKKWAGYSKEEKLFHIDKSLPNIIFNFEKIRTYQFIQKLYNNLFNLVKQIKEEWQ